MKRRLAWILALGMILALLTGCGGGAYRDGNSSAADSGSEEYGGASYGRDNTASSESQYGNYDYEVPMEAPSATEGETGSGENRLQNAKLIRTGEMEVETTAFDETSASLTALVEQLGGYLEYSSVNSRGSGLRYANYTVRIPSEKFQEFLEQVGELCHVLYQTQGQENISESYYDAESRLATQQTKLERLQALLSQAENMEDIIAIESAISETELEIEQLSGTLRRYDSLVDFSTITISLSEVTRLSNVEEPADTFWSRLGKSFVSGLEEFVEWIGSMILSLAYGWTWILLLVLIVVLSIRFLRKKPSTLPPKGRKNDTKTENTQDEFK